MPLDSWRIKVTFACVIEAVQKGVVLNLKAINIHMLVNIRKNREYLLKQTNDNVNPTLALHALKTSLPSEHKSFFTNRREQDDCSICPSIEKDVPEQFNAESLSEVAIDQLLEQSRLKDRALEKASSMIRLLEEENEQLSSQVGYLETLLKDQQRQGEALQEQLRQLRPSDSRTLIKDLMNERQQPTAPTITNDFFSFSQNRTQPQVRKSLGKIVNQDHPSFRDISMDINISKKLTPFASRQTVVHQQEEHCSISNILANLSSLLVQEGVGNSRAVMEEIEELLVIEQQEQEQLFLELQSCEQDLDADLSCELPHSPESSTISRRLFTLEYKHPVGGSAEIGDIIEKYQRCIQAYKQYAAYLRAHLCQCINFLAQQQLSVRLPEFSWLGSFLKAAGRDIGKGVRGKVKELQQQNWQLKRIMEEMIRNFEAAQGSTLRRKD